jgi:hypothetical protein
VIGVEDDPVISFPKLQFHPATAHETRQQSSPLFGNTTRVQLMKPFGMTIQENYLSGFGAHVAAWLPVGNAAKSGVIIPEWFY